MKKVKVGFLSILFLFLMLFVASCTNSKEKNLELKIKNENPIKVVVGTTINWENYVDLTYDDEKLDISNLNAILQVGNPNVVGQCSYYLYCNYDGKSVDLIVSIEYIADSTKTLQINVEQNVRVEISSTINPADYFTVTYGDETLPNTAAVIKKVSGDINTVGNLVYSITYTYLGITETATLTIEVYKNTDPLMAKFEEALQKTYDSYSFKSTFDTLDGYQIVDEEAYANDCYQIDYYEVVDGEASTDTAIKLFIAEDEKYVYIYEYDSDTDTWTNTPLTHTVWEYEDEYGDLIYGDYYPIMALPSELGLDVNDFEVVEGRILCKSNKLNIVGESIAKTGSTTAEFSEVEVVLNENGDIVQLIVSYTDEDDSGEFSVVYTIDYSKFNATTITLPDVEPEFEQAPDYVDPTTAVDLTAEQKAKLQEALLKEYDSFIGEYLYNASEGYEVQYEKDIVYQNLVNILYEYYLNGSLESSIQYYFEENNGNYFAYELDPATLTYVKTALTSDEASNLSMIVILASEFGLSADWFGYANGKYVIKPAFLTDAASAIGADSDSMLLGLEIEIDANNNVTDLYYVFKVTDNTYGDYYFSEEFSYSDFDSVTLPNVVEGGSVLSELTEDQKASLQAAFAKDFSNVTVDDTLFGSTFYFSGDEIVAFVYTEEGYVIDTYKIVDGTYYEVTEEGDLEIPYDGSYDEVAQEGEGFTYFVPVADFSKIDLTKMKYDSFTNSYYISAADLSITDFIFYYDYSYEFIYFEIELNDEGFVSAIYAAFEYTDTDNTTSTIRYSLMAYSEYGTTGL